MAEQANKRPAAHIVVEFDDGMEKGQLSLSLDEKMNLAVYGEKKSSFLPGEAAYLRLVTTIPVDDYTDKDGEQQEGYPYYLHTSAGTISTIAQNIIYEEEEIITFSMQDNANLSHKPNKILSWKWLGKDRGTPKFSGSSVLLNEKSVGVLKCVYNVAGYRCKLVARSRDFGSDIEEETELPVQVVAVQRDQIASLTVSYSGSAEEPVDVEILVTDFCSGDEVDLVEVYVDGEYIGKTNARGRVYVGKMVPNSQHTLRMTRAGFIDSDKDVLYNDLFKVPAPATDRRNLESLQEELKDLKDKMESIERQIENLS